MLFENALYYPTIDIKDEAWLKSAVLLWDTISTIVPESEDEPYKNEWTRAFGGPGGTEYLFHGKFESAIINS